LKVLIVHCHPVPQSFSTALYGAAREALAAAGHDLRCIDLYAEGFDPVLSREEREAYLVDPQLIERRVQPHVDALKWAEHLVLVYPTWYYGPPAMLKGWLERVWLPGVAFLPPPVKGRTVVPGLQHIRRFTVITHGGAPWWWLKVIGDPGKRLFTRGIRALLAKGCKTTWLQLHNMNNVSRDDCSRFIRKVTTTLGAMT
jgi:NAD(P)H dehydrogenase (quinone)